MPTRYEQERMVDDAITRLLNEQARELSLRDFTPKDYYCESRNLTGVPSNHGRTYKVAESSWDVHHEVRSNGTLRAVGKVRTVGGDVKVTKDGKTEIRAANSFRAPRTVKRTKRDSIEQANMVAEQLAAQSHRLELLAKAGNASEYNN